MKHWRLSTNISLYFENDTRYENSNNGRRIRTHMRSIRMVVFPMALS